MLIYFCLFQNLVRRFWIQHKDSRVCFHVDNCYRLRFSSNCSTTFLYNATSHRIYHEQSGRCIHRQAGNNGQIIIDEDCQSEKSRFRVLDDGFIQHVGTGYCIHPKKGGWSPPIEGETLVLWKTCSADRVKFILTPGKSTLF